MRPMVDKRNCSFCGGDIEPGTGKALEVRAGQIIRIAQVEGGQRAE